MSTIINNLNVIEYNENQVHIENKEKILISSLPINSYQIKNVFGSMLEVKVHECSVCGKKFILKDDVKDLKKIIKNINVQSLSNEDYFASTFDVIVNKPTERTIKVEPIKKKSRKEKKRSKKAKEKIWNYNCG